MTKRLEVYKCNLCGNIVEVNHAAGGTLVCCGQNMELLVEKEADSSTEKHVPVIEEIEGGYKVTVGSTIHPMTAEHYIEWIELVTEANEELKVYLKAGDEPVAVFKTDAKALFAREFCNVHGHWKANK